MYKSTVKNESEHENAPTHTQNFVCWKENLKNYTCSICNYTTYLKVHLKKHHHSKEEQIIPETLQTFTCDNCNLQTQSFILLMIHKQKCKIEQPVHRTIPMYRCNQCPYSTKKLYALRKHVEKLHCTTFDATKWTKFDLNIIPVKPKSNVCTKIPPKHHSKSIRPFKCDQCAHAATTKQYLLKHVESIHINELYKCDDCPFQTKFKLSLREHLQAYHSPDAVWFKCESCEYRGRTSRLLDVHKRYIHRVKKWFQCELCHFTTQRGQCLRRHMIARHTDEKDIQWFVCEQCGYRSKYKEERTRHMKIKHGCPVVPKWWHKRTQER